jgi:hypothetical protein
MDVKNVDLDLPQFDGHFEREYIMNLKGVSNEKSAAFHAGVQAGGSAIAG